MSLGKSKHELKRERLLSFVVALFDVKAIRAISKQQLVELASILDPPTTEVVAGRDVTRLRKANEATAKEVFGSLSTAFHLGIQRSLILGRDLARCHISEVYASIPNGGDLRPLQTAGSKRWKSAFDALKLPAIAASQCDIVHSYISPLTMLNQGLVVATLDGALGKTALYIQALRTHNADLARRVGSAGCTFHLAGAFSVMPMNQDDMRRLEEDFFLTYCRRHSSLDGSKDHSRELFVGYVSLDGGDYAPVPVVRLQSSTISFRNEFIEEMIDAGTRLYNYDELRTKDMIARHRRIEHPP